MLFLLLVDLLVTFDFTLQCILHAGAVTKEY